MIQLVQQVKIEHNSCSVNMSKLQVGTDTSMIPLVHVQHVENKMEIKTQFQQLQFRTNSIVTRRAQVKN